MAQGHDDSLPPPPFHQTNPPPLFKSGLWTASGYKLHPATVRAGSEEQGGGVCHLTYRAVWVEVHSHVWIKAEKISQLIDLSIDRKLIGNNDSRLSHFKEKNKNNSLIPTSQMWIVAGFIGL